MKKTAKTVPVLPLYVIKHKKPCREEYLVVRKVFPDGVPLTQESMDLAVENNITMSWVEDNLLTKEQRTIWFRNRNKIKDELDADCDAARQKYIEAKRKIVGRKDREKNAAILKALTKSPPT